LYNLAQHLHDILIVSTCASMDSFPLRNHVRIMMGRHVIFHLTLFTAIPVRTRFFVSFLTSSSLSLDVLDFETAAINGHVPLSVSLPSLRLPKN
jgi:hypothetical protein